MPDGRTDREIATGRASGTPARRPIGPKLFSALLAARWASLAIASVGFVRNLGTKEVAYGHFLPMIAVAFVYMALVTVFSERFYRAHMKGPWVFVLDLAVTLTAFSTTGTVWNPFLLFGACTFALAGLWCTIRSGVIGGVGVASALVVSLFIKGLTYADLAKTDSLALVFVYVLEFVAFSVAWAYLVRTAGLLDGAYAEVTSNRDRLAETNAALDDRHQELLALHRIRHAILLNLDAGEIVRIVMRALEEMGFDPARTWVLESGVLKPFPVEEGLAPIDAYSDHPIAVAAHDRETVITECGRAGEGDEGLPPPCIAVPILADNEVMGVVAVGIDGTTPHSPQRVEVLELFVGQIALALDHIRLYDQARDFAVAQERNRMTAQIHQTVVKRMYDASLLADSLMEDQVPPATVDRLRLLKETIVASLQDLRFAILNWSSLEWGTTPRKMVERYVREFTRLSGIPVAVAVEGEERALPVPKAKDLLRVLQEALSNVWRHSSATSVAVAVAFADDGVELSVADDGSGFDPEAAAKGGGIGLRSILDRGRHNEGTAEIDAAPGKGTRVRVWIPCR